MTLEEGEGLFAVDFGGFHSGCDDPMVAAFVYFFDAAFQVSEHIVEDGCAAVQSSLPADSGELVGT
nr:hypothetical protein [Rhodococcus sp. NCIMB 12038]